MASEVLAGRLLVATPVLGDPNFRRTVVLIVEHESEQGLPHGLTINVRRRDGRPNRTLCARATQRTSRFETFLVPRFFDSRGDRCQPLTIDPLFGS